MIAVFEEVIYHQFFLFLYYTNKVDKKSYSTTSDYSHSESLKFIIQFIIITTQLQIPRLMESTLSEVISELQILLEKAKALETRYMGQILALQKIVNITHKTVPQALKKDVPKKQDVKQQISREQVESKVDAFLSEIDLKQKNLENDHKPKFEVKPPEVVIEKKPPVPTASRNERVTKSFTPAYMPPKNKNEVTGKVTQTTIRASNQKVFKPEITAAKRSSSREVGPDKNNLSKTRQSMQSKPQKKEEKRQVTVPQKKIEQRVPQPITKEQVVKAPTIKPVQQQKEVQVLQRTSAKLASFRKDVKEILQQLFSKGKKNRKQILQKMIKDLQTEQLGYKKQQQSSRITFIRHAYNYSASRHHINPVATHRISRQKWPYYPEIFELGAMINNLQQQVKGLENIKEYRIDPRQEYKLIQTTSKLSEIVNQMDQEKGAVPDHLQLTFSHRQVTPPQTNQDADIQELAEAQLNNMLLNMLEGVASISTLQKSQLRGLQVLAEVGLFKSKKTPIMVPQREYEQWKSYYFTRQQ